MVEDEISSGGSYGDEDEGSSKKTMSGNVRKDLSEWQERHAVLVLSKVKVFISGSLCVITLALMSCVVV